MYLLLLPIKLNGSKQSACCQDRLIWHTNTQVTDKQQDDTTADNSISVLLGTAKKMAKATLAQMATHAPLNPLQLCAINRRPSIPSWND